MSLWIDAKYDFTHAYVKRCAKFATLALNHMNERSKGYPNDSHRPLGAKGEFTHVWRKTQLLKKMVWDGDSPVHEDAFEVCLDFVGHLLLLMDNLEQTKIEDGLNSAVVDAEPPESKTLKEYAADINPHARMRWNNPEDTFKDTFEEVNSMPPDWYLPAELIDAAEVIANGRIASPELRTRLKMFLDKNQGNYQIT